MRGNILRFIRENELIKPGSTLVCAVSGGKDSVCLLHVMRSLQKELSITVKAAHLNHQLRGEESDRDEAFVRSLCESLSVPLTVSHADVLTRCKETGESVEEAARVLRYRFFASLEGVVATAHTQDDNLETVLLNLVRGTALRGLCGIPPKRGQIIRPMLCVSRAEVETYLEQHALSHVEDSSNASIPAFPCATVCGMRSCRCCGGKTRTFPKQFSAWTPFCGRRIPTWKSRRLPCSSRVRCRRAAGHAAFCAPHRRHYRRARCGCFLRS